jgi:hypothetical protein
MRSEWNKGTPIDADLQEFTDTLTNIENFRRWAASNPPVKALPDGRLMRQATEDEWIAKATADNASNRKMDTDSVMSGWVINDTGTHVMQKIGKPTPYRLPKKSSEASQRADTKPEPEEDDNNLPFNSTSFLKYADAIGQIESGNKYDIVGGYNNHYQGRFQMGKAALKDVGIGYTQTERKAFLADPEKQNDAFEQFTLQNHNYLKARSQKYRDMSEREQLAVLGYAHNQGRGGALRFLQTGEGQTDGFGTEATTYVDAVREALG